MVANPAGARQIRGEVDVACDAFWLDHSVYLAVKTWRGADAELYQNTSWHSVNLTIEGGSALTGARIGGRLLYEGIDEPGALTFVPAGADRHAWYSATDLKYIGLFFRPQIARQLTGGDLGSSVAPRVNGRDPLIRATLSVLAQELERGDVPDVAVMEHAVGLVGQRLLTLDSTAYARADRHGRLAPQMLRQVAAYVDEHLANKISLSELASLADMPVFGFSRAFKLSIGVAPYQYILRRRIRRAEHLLTTTTMPIVDIAYAAGFASQSHLTTAFTRFAGQPPNAYRQARRG